MLSRRMKILILSYGTRGDVQPYVAIGKGLQEFGYHVTLGTSERFRDFVENHGLEFAQLSDELLAIIDTDKGRDLLENTTSFFDVIKQNIKLSKQITPLYAAQMNEVWETARRVTPDFILYHPKVSCAPHIAEKLGIGCALASPIPLFIPTSERPFFVFPDLKIGGWYNRMSYQLINLLSMVYFKKQINKFRSNIGLLPVKRPDLLRKGDGSAIPVLHVFSEVVLSRPSDWPDSAYVTGYCFLKESDWHPPENLVTFLEGGSPPVYIGFGSMVGHTPRRLAKIVVEALRIAGLRGIISSGWGGLSSGELPDTILEIESAPHDWLFPRVSAVVHHGGAGTTAAGLRAGKPSLIVPFFGDQPFWGRQVYALGAGPSPIPRKKLTSEKLASALTEAVSDPDMQRKATDLGHCIRREDGVDTAVSVIKDLLLEA